ncbi:MAG: D-alanyl-D-alanine carboxypeptidase/D-alanyl-D-alanine-endopeptidase [Beggiatoa sp. IS2]|nr:MAG: D-alanyl-D-alanine carboxypeptidase/D-alanyl-D-alanine-endopeptidase [Beggiatoa sp. IS2]
MFRLRNLLLQSLQGLSIGWLLLIAAPTFSQTNLSQAIDQALSKRCLDAGQTGVSVISLPSGNVLHAYNMDTPLLPASVMKLVTTAAALHYLGPEYRFQTRVLHTGQRVGNVIQGDLVIVGGGDPKISPQTLWHIADQLKKSGIDEVSGGLIADTHFFDSYDHPPDWQDDGSGQRAYNAKMGALSINYNIVAVHIRPGNHAGESLNVWLEPSSTYMVINNTGKTLQRGRNSVSARRLEELGMQQTVATSPSTVQINVQGSLRTDASERVIYLNVDDPARFAVETFRAYLQQVGIQVAGPTEVRSVPTSGKLIYRHESPPLSWVLKELNTYSNNFMAEQVVKTISAHISNTPGSNAQSTELIKQFISSSGANLQGTYLADGSGLSRNNRLTVHTITDVLKIMYQRFDIGPDFLSVLRVMGADGERSKRFSNSPAKARVRAKTGTLAGVSTLAGYVASENNQVYAYALFLNNNRCGHDGADAVENAIVNAIYSFADAVSAQTHYTLDTSRQ